RGSITHEVPIFGRLLCKYECKSRSVRSGLPSGSVVHAEHDIGTLRNKLRRFEQAEVLPAQPWIEFAEQIAAFTLPADFGIPTFVGDSRNCIFHPWRTRRSDDGSHMVDRPRVPRAQICGLDPEIFREIHFDEDALVVNGASC